jgi:hypothetical protein
MDSTFALIVTMVVAMNPPNVARVAAWVRPPSAQWARQAAVVVGVAAGILVAFAVVSDPLLDLIDVSGPTFRLGAAIVIGLAGARSLVWPGPPIDDIGTNRTPGGAATLLLFVALVVPATVFLAVSGGAVHGIGPAIGAVAVAAAASLAALLWLPAQGLLTDMASRFVGAAAVITAIAIGIDAARTV